MTGVKLTEGAARRTAQAVRAVEASRPGPAGPSYMGAPMFPLPWFGRIVACQDEGSGPGVGFATVCPVDDMTWDEHGFLSASIPTGAPEISALNGPMGWHEEGDVVWCVPSRGSLDGVPIRWVIVPLHMGLNYWASPDEDNAELSAYQDSPGLHSRCEGTVEPD